MRGDGRETPPRGEAGQTPAEPRPGLPSSGLPDPVRITRHRRGGANEHARSARGPCSQQLGVRISALGSDAEPYLPLFAGRTLSWAVAPCPSSGSGSPPAPQRRKRVTPTGAPWGLPLINQSGRRELTHDPTQAKAGVYWNPHDVGQPSHGVCSLLFGPFLSALGLGAVS